MKSSSVLCLILFAGIWTGSCSNQFLPIRKIVKRQDEAEPKNYDNYYDSYYQSPKAEPSYGYVPRTFEDFQAADAPLGSLYPTSVVQKSPNIQLRTTFGIDFGWILDLITRVLLVIFPPLGRLVQRFRGILALIAHTWWRSFQAIQPIFRDLFFRNTPTQT